MLLTGLRLAHFRNLASTELEIPPEGAVLEGANGQGKTNFLEAVHLLARFRSFRGTPLSDAIAFGADHFRVEGRVVREDGSDRTVAVATDGTVRRIAVDGRGVTPAGAAGAVLGVLVSPDDLALVAGSPGRRREYLDGVLAAVSRRYARALRGYERALRQRNEALRREEREAVLASWDEALVASGAILVVERIAFVARLASRFRAVAGSIAGAGERGDYAVAYRGSVPLAALERVVPGREAWDAGGSEDAAESHGAESRYAGDGAAETAGAHAIAECWRRALVAERSRDRARGWTGVGPHRDDVELELGGRPLARFGSQGEQRTAAVALRLLEAEVLEEEHGSRPILLLDDVFSELDEERGARLLDRLDDGARRQRFVTTPRPLPWLEDTLPRWRVAAGRFSVDGVAAGRSDAGEP